MDTRFQAPTLDTVKSTKVFLHPTATFDDIVNGFVQQPIYVPITPGTPGNNDMSSSGVYTDSVAHPAATYTVTIDGVGTGPGGVDTFTWIDNATGETASGVAMVGSPVPISSSVSNTRWAPSTWYALNAPIFDGVNVQMEQNAGESGSTQPVWNTALNGITTDGGVNWKNIGSITAQLQPSPIMQPLSNGFYVAFAFAKGHTLGDSWVVSTASDAIDLSPFVSAGSQSLFQATVTLNWNQELFGAGQPQPNQILEIQQQGITAWLGVIESISSYSISRGQRSMEVMAKSRDSLNLWRQTQFVSQQYVQGTPLTQIITDVAKQVGLLTDEIILIANYGVWIANTSYPTNTQIFDGVNIQIAVSGGDSGTTPPIWNTVVGETTEDGGVIWKNQGLSISPPAWEAETIYEQVGYQIFDGTNVQVVSIRGTSGAVAPAWNATLGGTTMDGISGSRITWVNQGPPSSVISTVHSNTQLSGMSMWDMLTTLFLPMGWAPFVDCLGRLRSANKNLITLVPGVTLSSDFVIQVKASRTRAPTTRVRLNWLDPKLWKSIQVSRRLASTSLSTAFFLPVIWQNVWFSADKTQLAENTYMRVVHSANPFGMKLITIVLEDSGAPTWVPDNSQAWGTLSLYNLGSLPALYLDIAAMLAAALDPDPIYVVPEEVTSGGFLVGSVGITTGGVGLIQGGGTIPLTGGSLIWSIAEKVIMLILMAVGTGTYEIWGNPFKWVHAKNTTEAFDQNAPEYVDNPVTIECDLIMNQNHSNDVAVRELLYRSYEANKWNVSIWDDLRIEYGDVIAFPDGSYMFVEDLTRPLQRDSNNNCSVKGFLINTSTGSGVAGPPVES